MEKRLERIHNAADFVRSKLGEERPEIGIVLGSGLGRLADQITGQTVIPYQDIPGFPVSTAISRTMPNTLKQSPRFAVSSNSKTQSSRPRAFAAGWPTSVSSGRI